MIGFLICVALFGAWSFFIVNTINKIVYGRLKFLKNLDQNLEERFKPFERFDRELWNIKEMYFCGIFLLPIRAFTLIIGLILIVLFFSILVGIKSSANKEEYPAWKRTLITFVSRCCARFILFIFGIYWIEKKYVQISDYDKDHPVSNNKDPVKYQRAPIMISNHVSLIDVVYHLSSRHFPSFLSKKEVQNIPLVGAVAKAIQCIFVDRDSRENKNEVRDALHERGDLIKQGKNFPPIVIFPEGTTTNGTHIISFKKGAFEPLLPVKIVCLEYPIRNFNLALDILGNGTSTILTLCQLKNNLRVTEFNTFYPDHLNLSHDREGDWQIYARKVKDVMLKAVNLKNSESGFRDSKEYLNRIFPKKNSSDQKISRKASGTPTPVENSEVKKNN